ncbi:MAG: RNA polymerase sigma factor RpoD/SigA [Gammaproteobacteria bacterium]|jgi:RNA polymerase sigma factor (sigma-70 family)|nr:RNA polymerase sigma factor RpoD/SigA [Gammaproteobacteria bacterium]
MERMDAAELYSARIYARAVPPPEVQLGWVWRIDRAQRRVAQAMAACPATWPLIAARLDAWLGGGDDPAVLGRWVTSSAAPGARFAECMALLRGGVAPHRPRAVLTSLRLRTECMADLQAHLSAGGADAVRLARVLDRGLMRVRTLTARLVEANQRLVAALARQYRGGPLAYMDLVQEGNLGLLRAIERFDPARGVRLSTYAMWWIRRAMVYAIVRQGQDVRPSVAQYWEGREVARTAERLAALRGRAVSHREIAVQLGVSVADVHRGFTAQAAPLALDAPLCGTDGIAMIDQLAAVPGACPERDAQLEDMRRAIQALLAQLPERHAHILRMRFGIGLRDDCTLEQIARQQGVTRERIRQLEAQALKALRDLDAAWLLRESL